MDLSLQAVVYFVLLPIPDGVVKTISLSFVSPFFCCCLFFCQFVDLFKVFSKTHQSFENDSLRSNNIDIGRHK